MWWGDDYFHVFPFFWHWDENWMLLPLAGQVDGCNALFPVFWDHDSLCVFPLFWKDGSDWVLLPMAWGWGGHNGVGPVWWGPDYFRVFPLFWKRWDDWVLAPLAWNRKGHKGVGPVWWGDDYFRVFPAYWRTGEDVWIPPLLARYTKEKDSREFRAFVRLLRWAEDRDGWSFELQPLLDVAKGRVSHFSLFWRLLERHRDEDESYWRFLFLPHKFGHRKNGS